MFARYRGRGSGVAPVLLMALLCLGAPMAHAALMGDVDGDGRVTASDAARLLRIVSQAQSPLSRDQLLGDLWRPKDAKKLLAAGWKSGDGHLTVEDVATLLRTAVGLDPLRDLGPVVYEVAGVNPVEVNKPSTYLKEHPDQAGDGPAERIFVADPYDLILLDSGEIYFSEYRWGRIRAMGPDGNIRTIAGALEKGYADGKGDQARFNHPEGIALLPDGSIVVADTFNSAIRKVTLDGTVTTLAGNGHSGYADGVGKAAQFFEPNGVATDPAGNIYVADTANNRIRKIAPDGVVTTLAGEGIVGFLDGPSELARFYNPTGLLYDDRDGGLYIADMSNNAIRKLSASGKVKTLAGTGSAGTQDGPALRATFRAPYGVDLDAQGRLWIADWGNAQVRVLHPNGRVTTEAGSPPEGYAVGPALLSKFRGLMNVRAAKNGLIYIAASDNETIQVLAP